LIKHLLIPALLALTCCAPNAFAGNQVQGTNVLITDGSGSVTTGAASQQVFGADSSRVYLYVQNPSTTLSGVAAESCFVNIGAAASSTAANSWELVNGASLTFDGNAIPNQAVNITCPTTGHKFVAKSGK
jgi:hypothetical protein